MSPAGTHILLLEDDADTASVLCEVLVQAGYSVTKAHSVEEAMAHLRSGLQPAAMVVDFSMPDMTGVEFIRKCATTPRLAGIPTLLMSAFKPSNQPPLASLVERFLQKPFEADELLQRLANLISR